MRITVLGAGSFGTTMATLVSARHATTLWARSAEVAEEITKDHTNTTYLPGYTLPESLASTADIEEAVSQADLLILGVPSHGVRSVLEQARQYVRPWIPVVSLTKGFEQDSMLRMSEIIRELLPGHPVAALTGPNIAKEIMAGYAAAAVIAADDLSVAAALQRVLRRGLFRIYTNHDLLGCEVGGALKNVIAIAAGMAQGLSVGDNTRAATITRGLAELTRLGVAMGGEPATFSGLAGMGDLIVTCVSPHSRNRRVGEQLGLGRSIKDILGEMTMVAEGVRTAVTVQKLAKHHGVEMPICTAVHRVLGEEISPAEAYQGLRRPGHESEPG